jgi:hypothetical protein
MLRMLGSRALVARLAPRHQATRHKGILSSFKESIDKEMKKNPELQKTLDELREGAAPLAKGAGTRPPPRASVNLVDHCC